MLSFKQLKQEVGLDRVLDHYGILDQLEQKGKSLRGTCPFCDASIDRPFSASLEKNAFQCFACKASGNIFDFVARAEGIDIEKGIRKVAEFVQETFLSQAEKPIERKTERLSNKAPAVDQSGKINPPLSFALKGIDPGHPFLATMGLSKKTAQAFGAGVYLGKGLFRNQMVIPIRSSEGELIAYTGIPVEGKPVPVYPPKFVKESVLFNLTEIAADDRGDPADCGLVLVRDPLQVLLLAQSGFTRSVGFLDDVLSDEQLRILLQTYGAGRKINLLSAREDPHTVENLSRLLPLFFVRLVRYEWNDRVSAGLENSELRELLALR